MPRISVIVPVYKAEEYLPACIDSVLAQTYKDFELILVNDGSPDHSGGICDEYAMRDVRIRVIHKENGGVSSARNEALDIAVGEYIVFVDSDDTVAPDYLELLYKWRSYDYVTAGFAWQDSKGTWHKRIFEEGAATIDAVRTLPSQYLGKYYFGSPWATLMKRELITKNKLRFDPSVHFGEDTLFIISYLAYASSLKIVPFCGYYYHYRTASLVNKPNTKRWIWRVCAEQAIASFFCILEERECTFLRNRQLSVLMNLVEEYAVQNDSTILKEIYTHPFFAQCIAEKRKEGSFRERLFILLMDRGNYAFYKKVDRCVSKVGEMMRRLKKMIWIR